MRLLLASSLFALLLVGCASSIMRGYIGKPLQEVMLDYGPPVNAFDMPDGSRAFQLQVNSTFVTPTTVSTSSVPVGGIWMTNTQISGGQAITSGCVYTMLARWDSSQSAWIFHDFRAPSAMCQ